MASTLQFTKQLITVQDMALGIGQVEQIRNGVPYTLDMINASNMAYDNETSLKDAVDTMYAQQDGLLDQVNASEAATAASATAAQLAEWRAQAWELTAQSYATEPEDTNCKVWVSNGDGTFIASATTDFSAKHWEAKALYSANNVNADNILHTVGSGLPNEGYNKTDIDNRFASRDLAVDGAKLDGIEDNATADQTAEEIRDGLNNITGLNADTLDGAQLSVIAKKTDYATSTVGGTVKMRVAGDTLYITNNGTNA